MEPLFLVIGTLPGGEIGAAIFRGSDEGSGMEPHPTLNPGGGGGFATPTHEIPHTDTCNNPDGAAAQVANTIMATDDVGPDEFDWTNAEFAATIIEKQPGVFGAYQGNVYSHGMFGKAGAILPEASTAVGIVHNHPHGGGTTSTDSRLQQRYPSNEDWDALDRLYEKYGAAIPSYDPVIWVVDSYGATRKFARSERTLFAPPFGAHERSAGQGLEGREVDADDC